MIYNLVQLIEQSVRDYPKKDAFRCSGKSLSYEALADRSGQLAHQLLASGVRKGDRVGIYMNRCIETAIAVYGILKSGAAFVPLDPFVPVSRTGDIIEDCGIEILITTATQQKRLGQLSETTSRIKTLIGEVQIAEIATVSWDSIFAFPVDGYEMPRILEEDLAYILYTSGSTGRPKGIMHTHRSGVNLAKTAVATFGFLESDIFGNPAPLHFDLSTFGYFAAPLVGATTFIIPDAHVKLPASLSELMARENITIWYSVPLMLIQLLQSGTLQKHDFTSLRWVLFAGEVFVTKHLRELMDTWPHARFSNLYGPAELNVCTYYNVDAPPATDDPVPIGKVWANTEYKILGDDDNEVEKGAVGELVVRTATQMQGYWNDVPLTENSLYKIRIAEAYEHIYYRTGDQVRENERGQLLFLGRNDRQIKLRGYRVELDEIESVILKHDAIEEAAVTVIVKDKEIQKLIAFVKAMPGSEIDDAELMAFCRTKLPTYAVPESIRVTEDFHRTSSGKIDRKKMAVLLKTELNHD